LAEDAGRVVAEILGFPMKLFWAQNSNFESESEKSKGKSNACYFNGIVNFGNSEVLGRDTTILVYTNTSLSLSNSRY
jgi:hypothetical protein